MTDEALYDEDELTPEERREALALFRSGNWRGAGAQLTPRQAAEVLQEMAIEGGSVSARRARYLKQLGEADTLARDEYGERDVDPTGETRLEKRRPGAESSFRATPWPSLAEFAVLLGVVAAAVYAGRWLGRKHREEKLRQKQRDLMGLDVILGR